MQQYCDEEMLFNKQERIIDFFFNQFVDGVVHKLLRAQG
jgi:hypothetical protein